MLYAHITDGVIDSIGQPPQLAFLNGRWYDLRDRNIGTLAIVGWYPVTEVAKPADTATMTWTANFALVDSAVVQSWTQIAKTVEQLANEQATANQLTIEQALDASLVTLQTIIDDTNANINTNPAQRIKDEARAIRRIIRLVIRRFDGTV